MKESAKKKLIIVNNNMKVGGVQKSLYNLLWTVHDEYEITLYLFCKTGALVDLLPPDVNVMECPSLFRYLGISQGEAIGADKIKRGLLAACCRVFGRAFIMRFILASQKMLPDTYDCAISFLHNGSAKSFYGGVQDFVLHRVNANKKIAFLHCDYRNCGADYPRNNRNMEKFDRIAACSDGCRRVFEEVLPHLKSRCVTVRNCHRFDEIRALAAHEPIQYDATYLHVITVARLSHEKGVERAVRAVSRALSRGLPIMLHIVGGGAQEQCLKDMAKELGISKHIAFYGEQSNPYRYMVQADLFLLTSYHEAAPMVIEESIALGLPVLTVETISSREMVIEQAGGWVCENTQQALEQALVAVLSDRDALCEMRNSLQNMKMNNETAEMQFSKLIED